MRKMSKTTAKIPKSRSKYLMQFLKKKAEGSRERTSSNQDNLVTVYSSIAKGMHRRGNSTRIQTNIGSNEGYQHYNNDQHMDMEWEEDKYQTPKNNSNRRRVKKIERYEDYDQMDYNSSSNHLGFESTAYTREPSELAKIRHERRKNFVKMNMSLEKVHQVHISDESIDDIDEDEECASIPSEEKTKKEIHNEFYHKINRASQHKPGDKDDPYCLMFDQDLSLNKMIDEIICSRPTKFSDRHEQFGDDEAKEEITYDVNSKEDSNEITITPEYNMDSVPIEVDSPDFVSPLTKEQKKNFKHINKFKKTYKNKEVYRKDRSPVMPKRKTNLKLKCFEPLGSIKKRAIRRSSIKQDKLKRSASKGKEQIKSKSKINPVLERLISNFYNLLSNEINKQKLLEQFKSVGKGGVIELQDEPIFPLKTTLDYLLMQYSGCNFNIKTVNC